ncbi:MAG TPA: DUF1858 domain-containing protein [Microvirga sp.]|nr:DUF1858 domain-containing protein [Microvirga sp.]
MPVASNDLVDDIMGRWPATIRIFLDHGMRCVGCPIACVHTVDDACREHGVSLFILRAEINEAVRQGRAMWARISAPPSHEARI